MSYVLQSTISDVLSLNHTRLSTKLVIELGQVHLLNFTCTFTIRTLAVRGLTGKRREMGANGVSSRER